MDFEQALSSLMLHYGLHTQTELANKLGTTQSTISGWRARNSIGALVAKVADVDQRALPHLFPQDVGAKADMSKEQACAHYSQPQNNPQPLDGYFLALKNIAFSENREDELLEHFKWLVQTYAKGEVLQLQEINDNDGVGVIFEKTMSATTIVDHLMDFYKVSTITELAEKMGSSQSTVTKWRQNNSINAIKKKCRELGIYQQIFQ